MQAAATSDASRMDRHYRYQRLIYDATRTHYLIGRKHLIADLRLGPGESVLEIGCGTAWNLAKAARRYPDALLYGIDVSNVMLETARGSLRRKGLAERVTLRQGDATCFDPVATFRRATFDRIYFSYTLSMIPRWETALAHAATMIAPGGALHVVDFGQCEHLPKAFQLALFAFLAHYTVAPRADLKRSIREVAKRHGLSSDFRRLHRGYTEYCILRR